MKPTRNYGNIAVTLVGMGLSRVLPRRAGFWLARRLAGWARRRRIRPYRYLRENMGHLFPDLAGPKLDEVAEQAAYELACTYFDMFHIRGSQLTRGHLLTVDPAGWERARRQFEDPSGTLVVAGHLGNFDLAIQWVAEQGIPVQLLSLPDQGRATQTVNAYRQKNALVVTATSTQSLREAVRRLRAGGTVGTGVDRPMSYDDPPIQFFGAPAPLPRGHVRLALQTGARVMVASCIRRPDRTYLLNFWPPLDMVRTGSRDHDVELNARRVLDLVEESIMQAPTQWGMLHPVWSKPESTQPML